MSRIIAPVETQISIIAKDTLEKKKQALIFVNSKRSAEKEAEELSEILHLRNPALEELAKDIETTLSKPTTQCIRLAKCVRNGVAFHHAGLHSKQKEIVEKAFKERILPFICCTPTLAAGLDLPAFRTIIRDVRRFGNDGMDFIPVLEFLQMAGRAGRPRYDEYGETIVLAHTEAEKEKIAEKYIHGEPEAIYSKLAVEPVIRTTILSLVASLVVRTKEQLLNFFEKTFWAHQYEDVKRLQEKLEEMQDLLEECGFISIKNETLEATLIGKRVAELYIDPLTARHLLTAIERAKEIIKEKTNKTETLAILHSLCYTLEMRPRLKVKTKEYEEITEKILSQEPLFTPPSEYEEEYSDYLDAFKTALLLNDWMEEKDEDYLLEKYDARPGELRAKTDKAIWIIYAFSELARLLKKFDVASFANKLRTRLQYGVKEELLALLQLEQIGRVRARKLYNYGLTDIGELRKTDLSTLSQLLGKSVAELVKKQLGQETPISIPEGKRTGQMGLGKYVEK